MLHFKFTRIIFECQYAFLNFKVSGQKKCVNGQILSVIGIDSIITQANFIYYILKYNTIFYSFQEITSIFRWFFA